MRKYLFQAFTADQGFLDAPWSGARDGRWCRCYLCGHFFKIGDRVRSIYSNFPGSPFNGNPFVCESACGAGSDGEALAELGRRQDAIPWWAGSWGREPPGRYERRTADTATTKEGA